MAESRFIRTEDGTLHCVKEGEGSEQLLIFHGFGQSHEAFRMYLSHPHSSRFTFYFFDLFFHGASTWHHPEKALEKSQWAKFLLQFLQTERVGRFQLMGFSLGAKFALAAAEHFPDRIDRLWLLAPDGIKTNFWYSLATYPYLFRHLFKSMIRHHQRFTLVARAARSLGFIDNGVLRFVEFQMNTESKRALVYNSWVVFRHLTFSLPQLSKLFNSNGVRVTFIIGKHDRIIAGDRIREFAQALSHAELLEVETGHNGLVQEIPKFL